MWGGVVNKKELKNILVQMPCQPSLLERLDAVANRLGLGRVALMRMFCIQKLEEIEREEVRNQFQGSKND